MTLESQLLPLVSLCSLGHRVGTVVEGSHLDRKSFLQLRSGAPYWCLMRDCLFRLRTPRAIRGRVAVLAVKHMRACSSTSYSILSGSSGVVQEPGTVGDEAVHDPITFQDIPAALNPAARRGP